MIKPEQIPIEAVYAVADTVMGDNDTDCLREALAAAINAWPGADILVPKNKLLILLPLPQEPKND